MNISAICEQNTITIKEFMDCINYRITDGYDYLWKCFGNNCYCITSDGPADSSHTYSTSIVFSTVDHTVFTMEIWDYSKNVVYVWVNPSYETQYKSECAEHGIKLNGQNDSDYWITLDLAEDILDKASKIVRGEPYDDRVLVPLTLPDDMLFLLMKCAHEQDVSLNQFVEKILQDMIESHKIQYADK